MRVNLESMKASFAAVAQKAKVRKGMLTIIAVFFVLQIYFVRELLAAEPPFVGIVVHVVASFAPAINAE